MWAHLLEITERKKVQNELLIRVFFELLTWYSCEKGKCNQEYQVRYLIWKKIMLGEPLSDHAMIDCNWNSDEGELSCNSLQRGSKLLWMVLVAMAKVSSGVCACISLLGSLMPCHCYLLVEVLGNSAIAGMRLQSAWDFSCFVPY